MSTAGRPGIRGRIGHLAWLARTLVGSGMIAPSTPAKYVRMIALLRRQGTTPLTGLSLSAIRRPDATAIVDERGELTWAQLDRRCDALAAGLATFGPTRPTTVAVLCRNHAGLVEMLGAAGKLGADALLLNTGFSGPQLSDVLRRESAEVIVYDEEFAGIVDQARQHNPDLRELIAWTTGASDAVDTGASEIPTIDDLIRANLGARAAKPATPGRVVLLTSGTTGTPKGARRSGSSGGALSLAAMLARIPWKAEQTTVVAAPIFHAWGFGQLAIAASMCCTVVMRRKFDPVETLRMVEDNDATGLALVPVMLERIMELPSEKLDEFRLRSLRFVTVSGSRMRPEATVAFMDRFGDVVYNSYNATEAGLISTATPTDLRAAPDTAGRPLDGTSVRILDEARNEAPVDTIGAIAVYSESQFEGYTSGDTKDFHENYMLSGDLGRIDENGRLFVVGRDDDMIVSGGENVYPLEVEQTLDAHPAVLEAAVIGVDDDKFGQRLAAFVVLRPGEDASAEDLQSYVKQQLAGYKVPRAVSFLDTLPRNATGKVVKRELIEEAN
ncbi:AMP-binding protein [Aldersonia sp. NBC_00410]|uniref:AMP-binding protein n=1 Tax=Aldersonia sp. NBC_00410 TaxID=2975954 RepID=UPI00225466D0|nr:AMP-binding protein [Aldersonia sp. NBC_00410]MCX5045325.1 AMP-binding protein [Aldersonia sp. NBC_00410]